MGIQFNLTIEDPVKREIFRDMRFRIAFSHAIDRDEINEATQCATQQESDQLYEQSDPSAATYQDLADDELPF